MVGGSKRKGLNQMTRATAFYLDGLLSWAKLNQAERVWICANRPEAAPRGAMLDFMGA